MSGRVGTTREREHVHWFRSVWVKVVIGFECLPRGTRFETYCENVKMLCEDSVSWHQIGLFTRFSKRRMRKKEKTGRVEAFVKRTGRRAREGGGRREARFITHN